MAVQGFVDVYWYFEEDPKENFESAYRFVDEIAVDSVLQVGELDVDDGLDDAILGRDPGLCVDGAAVVFEQVVHTALDCWKVCTEVDVCDFRI